MSRLINRLCGRVYGWFDSKDAEVQTRRAPSRYSRRARLVLTDLEDRAVPATFLVTNADDAGAGSLRDAITLANAAPGDDAILFNTDGGAGTDFSVGPNTITLLTALPTISGTSGNNLGIFGTGADRLTVAAGATGFRAFTTGGGGNNFEIRDMTISGFSLGTGLGGAIDAVAKTNLTLNRVHVLNNTMSAGSSGGINMNVGVHNILNSTIVGNSTGNTGNTGGGGGLRADDDGAIGSVLNIVNSTIYNNTSAGSGGGLNIADWTGSITITNSTISGNVSKTAAVAPQGGGGIARGSATALGTPIININASIIAGNTTTNATGDITGTTATFNVSNSVVGEHGVIFTTDVNNAAGPLGAPVDAKLSVPALNGGLVPTMMPASDSPAVNKYNPGAAAADQRGQGRPATSADAGAVERQVAEPPAEPPVVLGFPRPFVTVDDATTNPYVLNVPYYGADTADFDSSDIRVTGPNGFNALASFVSFTGNSTYAVAKYSLTPPVNGAAGWDSTDTGEYLVSIDGGSVETPTSVPVQPQPLGTFRAVFATTFTVTNTDDSGAGSLRQAILDANANAPAKDTIVFDASFNAAKTISLLAALPAISESATLTGPGSSLLTVQRDASITTAMNMLAITGTGTLDVAVSGLRLIGNTLSAVTTSDEIVLLSDLNISGVTLSGSGGGVNVGIGGTLTLKNSVISGNSVSTNGGAIFGGSSTTLPTTITIDGSTLESNTANTSGGGVAFTSTTGKHNLFITNSSIVNNSSLSATTSAGGGGVFFPGLVDAVGFLVRNTTISGNKANGSGGGVHLNTVTGAFNIQNSTIVSNVSGATVVTDGIGGGGIAVVSGTTPTLSLESTIVSGNSAAAANNRDDLAVLATTLLNVDFSAIADVDGYAINGTNTNNLTNADSTPAALVLGPLNANGGLTKTHHLGLGSKAVNAGSNPVTVTPALTLDQTGNARVVGAQIDIGAFERDPNIPVAVIGALANVTKDLPGTNNPYTFTVTYTDDAAMAHLTLNGPEVQISRVGGGFTTAATVVSLSPSGTDTSPIVATYKFTPPGGGWDAGDNAFYSIEMLANDAKNTGGFAVRAATMGSFRVSLGSTFAVTNTGDSGAGSLRQAILDANADASTPDTIIFDASFSTAKTINLLTVLPAISGSVAITGPGSNLLTVRRDAGVATAMSILPIAGTGILEVSVSGMKMIGNTSSAVTTSDETVSFTDVHISGVSLAGSGGAISVLAGGTVSVTNSTLTGNSVSTNGGAINVAGSATTTTSLFVSKSTISGNTATTSGGGISMTTTTGKFNLFVTDSSIWGNKANSATTTAGGGGIFFAGVVDSTGVLIRNSTISSNTAVASGGGVLFNTLTGTVNIQNSTISANESQTVTTTVGIGGGGIALVSGTTPTLNIESTILSGNTANATNGRSDLATIAASTINVTFSAIGDVDGFALSGGSGNNLSTADSAPAALNLGPLGNFGGTTKTHFLAAPSKAEGKGSNPTNITPALTTDQTGGPRVLSGAIDIGAFELNPAQPLAAIGALPTVLADNASTNPFKFTVTYSDATAIDFTTIDGTDITVSRVGGGFTTGASLVSLSPPGTNAPSIVATYQFTPPGGTWDVPDNGKYDIILGDGEVKNSNSVSVFGGTLGTLTVTLPQTFTVTNTLNTGAGSLRQAILDANLNTTSDFIVFDPTVFSTAKTILLATELLITEAVTITGPGANLLTIDSSSTTARAIQVSNAASQIPVQMSGFTISGVVSTTTGAGIEIQNEFVTLTGVQITGNSTSSAGGAISAAVAGGGLKLINSSLTNNTAGSTGGAIRFVMGTLGAAVEIRNSTISGNTGTIGGAFYGNNWNNVVLGPVVVSNSTIINNVATTTGGGAFRATSAAGVLSLISSVVANNSGATGPDILNATVNSTNSVISNSANFTKGSSVNDLPIGTPTGLLSLADNGGPNGMTHAFDATSPLKHKGLNPAGLTTDQRGAAFGREFATGLPDIGAYEFVPSDPEAFSKAFTNVFKSNALALDPYTVAVYYMAGSNIDAATLDGNDVRVTGPNGFDKLASFVSSTPAPTANALLATYKFAAPVGGWTFAANGTYTVAVEGGQVSTVDAKVVLATTVGTFDVAIGQTFTVSNTNDSGVGSLRDALLQANATTLPDEVVFSPLFNAPQTITLTSGELPITESVIVIGPSVNVTISGNNATRIFNISNAASVLDVGISNITVTNGFSATAGGGISINSETVTLTDVTVRNSSASANGGGIALLAAPTKLTIVRGNIHNNIGGFGVQNGSNGGGLDTGGFGAIVSITDSSIANNSAQNNGGGLGQAGGGSVTLLRTSVTGNVAGGHSGAFYLNGALTFTADNSTISGNSSGTTGGAIHFTTSSVAMTFRNSTVVNNTANSTGGAINRASGTSTVNLISTIIAGNVATTGPDMFFNAATTINANNSLIGVADSGAFTFSGSSAANLTGTLATPLNPRLGPLSANGGLGLTNTVLAGSPAVDAGSNPQGFTTDGRGGLREDPTGKPDMGAYERVLGVPSASGGPYATIDAGNAAANDPYVFTVTFGNEANIDVASLDNKDVRVTGPAGFNSLATFVSAAPPTNDLSVVATYKVAAPVGGWKAAHNGVYTLTTEAGEVLSTNGKSAPVTAVGTYTTAIGQTFTVTNTNDSGPGSLRQALLDANASIAPDSVVFDSSFNVPRTIPLTTGNIPVSDSVTITGPGPNLLTVSAEKLSRIFLVFDLNRMLDVTMSGMTLTNGVSTTGGGAIAFSGEKLTLTDMHLTGNSSNTGGALASEPLAGAYLSINRTALTNNTSSGVGGAIRIQALSRGATFLMQDSTISGNTGSVGGGFYGFNWNNTFTTLKIANSTITNNSATGTGGGGMRVSNATPTVFITSTIFAGNSGATGPDILNGTIHSSFSAIGVAANYTVGSTVSDVAPGTPLNLQPLANNGGLTPTHAFSAGSPLIDAGVNPNGAAFDQRGPGFARELPVGEPDIGAFERVPGIPGAVPGPLQNVNIDDATTNPYTFTVTYSDDVAIDVATIINNNNAVKVSGPGGFSVGATYVSIDDGTNGTPRTATYNFVPPGGTWNFADNGNYTVTIEAGQVKSTIPVAVPAGTLGTFNVGFQGTYIVTNANDDGPGSLRAALTGANNAGNTADVILFDTTFFNTSMKTIALLSPLPAISDAVTITGPGSSLARISGEGKFRLLNLDPAPAATVITISGLTLANASTIAIGGAINVGNELVTLDDMILENNQALEGGAVSVGSAAGSLTITNSRLLNNTALEDGGAINVQAAAPISITASTLSGNLAGSDGGGIYFVSGGSLNVIRSTVSGNTANGTGGPFNLGGAGIYFFGVIGAAGFRIHNSTISGNTHTSLPGGGLALAQITGSAEIFNSTITGNKATNGGGIARVGAIGAGGLTITSSIVAGNTTSGGAALDISFGVNFVNISASAVGTDPEGSLINYAGSGSIPFGTDLKLGALANNGGATLTHRPLAGSPLLDAGSNPNPLIPDVDQIGNPRLFAAQTDIGSVEVQGAVAPVVTGFTVNGGAVQRSRITTITINFTSTVNPVDFLALGAITLTRTAATPTGVVGTIVQTGATGANGLITVTQPGPLNQLVLTFSNANGDNESAGVEYGSLADGRWQLAVPSASFTSGLNDPTLRRLFGDFEAGPGSNGTVDAADFAEFGTAFGSSGAPGFSPFDYDNNGTIDSGDLGAVGARFGFSV